MWWLVFALFATGQVEGAKSVEAGSIPTRIEALLDRCESSRRGVIAQLEFQLRGLKSQELRTAHLIRQIANIEKDLKSLRANTEPIVPPLRFPPEVGAIGRLPRLECHVDRVISEREMLARSFFPVKIAAVEHFRARGETIVRPVTFLIRGLATDRSQEGADLALPQVFEITGTETDKSAGGPGSTVWVLSEFDMKTVEPYFRARKASR